MIDPWDVRQGDGEPYRPLAFKKPEEALSEAQRRAANEWFDHTLYSRLNDKRSGAIVIIMQRLHEDDLSAMSWRKRHGRY